MPKKTRNAHMSNQNKMAASLDQLALFEEMQDTFLPKLQKLMREGASPEKIYKEFGSLVSARAVNIALTEEDPAKALAAIKEILDRGIGRPVDKIETTHRYSQLSDQDLDNLLKSTMKTVELEDDETLQ